MEYLREPRVVNQLRKQSWDVDADSDNLAPFCSWC